MIVERARRGTIDPGEECIITIRKGLVGFEHARHFRLVPHRPGSPFSWLQCTDIPGLAFAVVDPANVLPDCRIEITDDEAALLEISNPEQAAVLTTVSLDLRRGFVTTNLAGPILINTRTLVGMQLVLDEDRCGIPRAVAGWPMDSSALSPAA